MSATLITQQDSTPLGNLSMGKLGNLMRERLTGNAPLFVRLLLASSAVIHAPRLSLNKVSDVTSRTFYKFQWYVIRSGIILRSRVRLKQRAARLSAVLLRTPRTPTKLRMTAPRLEFFTTHNAKAIVPERFGIAHHSALVGG